jgi:hypothetical protein
MQPVKPFPHAVLDYGLALLFIVAPKALGFGSPAAIALSHGIGVLYLAASLVTGYPLGAVHLLPFRLHRVLESALGVAWIALPWLFGFATDAVARNFFVLAGLALLVVTSLTDYRAADRLASGRERRRGRKDRRLRATHIAAERRVALVQRRRLLHAAR